jgi:hypothetical protein
MSTRLKPARTAPALPDAAASTAAGLRAWIASGAAQSSSGAFVAWVDRAGGQGSYEYPEITGYALTYLASLSALTESERAAGDRAAAWLATRVGENALAARDGWDNDAVYLFDLGVIASGLLLFGGRTRSSSYLEAGSRLARLLAGAISRPRGLSAVWEQGPRSGRAGWSIRGVAHLAKLVQALLLSEEPSFAARLIEVVKSRQEADGRMCTDDDDRGTVMLHPHLYAAEGLWMWGTATGDTNALQHSAAALDWVLAHQLDSGGFPRSVAGADDAAPAVEQSDVTAQTVRLALVLGRRTSAVDRAAARLVETARTDVAGLAIPYQPEAPDIHLNVWATLFAAQALALSAGDAPQITWRELV